MPQQSSLLDLLHDPAVTAREYTCPLHVICHRQTEQVCSVCFPFWGGGQIVPERPWTCLDPKNPKTVPDKTHAAYSLLALPSSQ